MRSTFHFFGSVGISFLCNLSGPWPILMGSVILVQGLVFRPVMGMVPGCKRSLFLRVVRGVNGRACPGMVLAQFGMANLIRAGGDVFMGILTMLLVVMGRGCRFASW